MTQTVVLLSRATAAMLLAIMLSGGAIVQAQEPAEAQKPADPAEPATPPKPRVQLPPRQGGPPHVTPDTRNVNIDVTVTQQLGGEPVSKTMTFAVADGSGGSVRSGIRVPVATAMPASVSYESVGFNIDAGIRILDNDMLWLDMSLEFSSVLPARDASRDSEAKYPSFSNATSNLNLLLENGKPVTFTQATDPSTGQQYEVSVKATILK